MADGENRSLRTAVSGQRAGVRKQGSEGRYQRAEVREQRSEGRQRFRELSGGIFIGIWILVFGIFSSGCVTEPSRTYKKEFVNTYAELTLLYEKQKMEKKETDSTYKVKVEEFFNKKGLKQEEFKKEAEELSQKPHVWKLFITDVTTAIDSIKAIP